MLGYIVLTGRAAQFDVYMHRCIEEYVTMRLFQGAAVTVVCR